jgi:uncharacterized protein YjeT (DUF2065 family)
LGTSLWTAIGLVLIIEGALPFVSPRVWREMFSRFAAYRDGQIRFFALISLLAGLTLLLAARPGS